MSEEIEMNEHPQPEPEPPDMLLYLEHREQKATSWATRDGRKRYRRHDGQDWEGMSASIATHSLMIYWTWVGSLFLTSIISSTTSSRTRTNVRNQVETEAQTSNTIILYTRYTPGLEQWCTTPIGGNRKWHGRPPTVICMEWRVLGAVRNDVFVGIIALTFQIYLLARYSTGLIRLY